MGSSFIYIFIFCWAKSKRSLLKIYIEWQKKKKRERKPICVSNNKFQLPVSFRSMFTRYYGPILICSHWNVASLVVRIVHRCASWLSLFSLTEHLKCLPESDDFTSLKTILTLEALLQAAQIKITNFLFCIFASS